MKARKMHFPIDLDAAVKIFTLRDLKAYLEKTIDTFNGYKVKKWIIRGDEIRIDIEVLYNQKDSCLGVARTTPEIRRVFFGYVEDVGINIQAGMYE